jgi:hypothetical protein
VAVSSGFTATLGASPAKGATTITVDDTTGATAGDTITLALGEDKEWTTTISEVTSGTVLTLSEALPWAFTHTLAAENTVTETVEDGADVILTPKNNLVVGVQRDITIEPERKPSLRRTDYIFTMRVDFQVLNPAMSVIMKNAKVRDDLTS